jgi:hypothetical protein
VGWIGLLVAAAVGVLPAPPAVAMPTTLLNFTGQADAAVGTISPPDPMGAAGSNNYVQVVNLNIEVWNKSGTVVAASKSLKSLWAGYTGTNAANGCATRNDGDPIVRYDQMAGRWLVAQFSLPNQSTTGGPSFDCVAVSKTGDPTGAYWLYDFKTNDSINEQTKIGVWSDGYYETSRRGPGTRSGTSPAGRRRAGSRSRPPGLSVGLRRA